MAKVEGGIPNLINGVSQQAHALRLPSQAEASENFYPTTSESLIPRPRTDHVAALTGPLPALSKVHLIHRDADEHYAAVFYPNGSIRVWGYDGVERMVNDISDGSYLSGLTDPADQLKVVTEFDYTFVVRKDRKVVAGTSFTSTRPYEALINVLAGNYGRSYRIFINGTERCSVLTPNGGDASHSPYIDTTFLAERLRAGLQVPLGDGPVAGGSSGATSGSWDEYGTGFCGSSPWTLGRYNHVIYVSNPTADFTITTEDGYSGKAMTAVKGAVQKFSDLPTKAPEGCIVQLTGTDSSENDNYWVKFTYDGDGITTGVWAECARPGSLVGFQANTAPHVLVRESDGTFTFKVAPWTDRKVGDEDRNPDPSFVGQEIEDLFWFKNRLGMLTRENCVLSASSAEGYWRFYRGTLTTLLDTEPIDIGSQADEITKLRYAVPHQAELILFSDNTQFILKGNEVLTPKTVNFTPLTSLNVVKDAKAVSVGQSLYIPTETGSWGSLFEYFIDKTLETAEYSDVAAHCPSYVPAGIRKVVAQPNLSLIFIRTIGDPTALYVYKFFFNGQEKIQSAWQKWTFPGVTAIHDIKFDGATLYMALERGAEGLFLESMKCGVGLRDEGSDFYARLDRCVTLTYPYTLPYAIPDNIRSTDARGFTYSGITDVGPLKWGVPFRAIHRLSPIHLRADDGKTSKTDGKLTLQTLFVTYSKAHEFRVEVTPEARRTRVYPFWSDGPADGHLAVPVHSRSDRVTIDIITDSHRPSAFVAAKWRGTWAPYNREG